jgi:uncharacterized membrane protein YccC
MHYKRKLMACTAILGVWPLVLSTAGAQSASEAAKIERLERQTELLQRQLRELQQEIARREGRPSGWKPRWKPRPPVLRPRRLPVLW